MKEKIYKFRYITECDMCKSPSATFKLLGRRMNQSQGRSPRKQPALITSIQQCKNCGLIFSNPQPIPFDIQDHYGVAPDEYWTEEYFNPDPQSIKAIVEKSILYGGKNGKVLDVGSGVGFGLKAMLDAGMDAVGIEPSEPFYNYAISKNGIPSSRLVLTSLENASFPDSTFDYVNMGAVLEHLYSPSDSLQKVLQWVKPGGKIEIEVPNAKWYTNKLFNLYYKYTFQHFVANLSPMHPPYHLHEFDLKSFEKNGKVNNYEVIGHHYYLAPTFLPSVFNKPLRYYMKKTKTGMQLIVLIQKN